MASGQAPHPLRLSERRVLAALRGQPALSRSALVEVTGLPRATVLATVTGLLRRGVLAERDDDPGSGPRAVGRPASVLSVVYPAAPVAVISFAHSSTTIALCGYAGTVLARRSVPIARGDDLAEVLPAVRAELADLGAAIGIGDQVSAGVVAVPLPFRRGQGVARVRPVTPSMLATFPNLHPLPDWLLTDPSARFTEAFGVPVVAENDANLAALGETVSGAGHGHRGVVYVAAKDGIGAGLVLDGRLYRGAGGIAGELGHISVRDDGQLCVCGNRGCLVTVYRNGPQLIDEIQTAYGQAITFEDMQSLAEHGDVGVRRILADLGRTVGRPLADLSVLLNPDVIVVDGSLGAAAEPVVAGVREMIDRHAPPMISEFVQVVAGRLGGDAQLVGAAALARECHLDELLG